MSRPTPEEVAAVVREHGSIRRAAPALGVDERTVRRWLHSTPVAPPIKGPEKSGVTVDHEKGEATVIGPPTTDVGGAVEELIRENGLDPDEWVVVSTTLNRWNALGKAVDGRNPNHTMRQVKVTLVRKPHLIMSVPAAHVPPIQPRERPYTGFKVRRPELIVIEGDHQVPYHDSKLHEASLQALCELHDGHNLVEHIFLGDTGDFPTISKHPDHPAAMASVNEVIQGTYELLRDKREAAPNARARKLKGNHDWRVESELLLRAERMYGIKPASIDGEEEIPALSLRRLLHLDALSIELVEDPRGWQHAEIELVDGLAGLVVRHGWLTGANTASRSLAKRGRSMVVGHTHAREHVFRWDPSVSVERQAAVAGTMSLVRDQRFPHFATLDSWLQGFVTVTRWPDGQFVIEHAIWDGETLRWRDRRWNA